MRDCQRARRQGIAEAYVPESAQEGLEEPVRGHQGDRYRIGGPGRLNVIG